MDEQGKKDIGLYALTMIAIGSSIGSGIFKTPSEIAGYLPAEGLIAQRKFKAAAARLEPGGFERSLQGGGVLTQEVEGLRSVRSQMGRDVAAGIDIELHVDPPQLRRVEPNLETLFIARGTRRNLDREARYRHRRRT